MKESYLSVPKWDEFQHYKDRAPPWIKLHNSIMENYQFECLPDASKAHLFCIWLLASRTNNKINNDPQWIARRIGANSKVNIDILVENGFLVINQELQSVEQNASTMLAECYREESRGEQNNCETPEDVSPVPYARIVDLYHSILPELRQVAKLNETRKAHVRQRWKNDLPEIEEWEKYFSYVRESAFLMGHVQPSFGRKPFIADFDFLINGTNALKIAEGKYHG